MKLTKPILCVDFDGVIHSYSSPWTNAETIPDGPVPGALEWLAAATLFFDVQIYSSRSRSLAGIHAMRLWFAKQCAAAFPMGHLLNSSPWPITFCHEKPPAFLTIDDRAICFQGDWAGLDPAELRKFKPWNKKGQTDGK